MPFHLKAREGGIRHEVHGTAIAAVPTRRFLLVRSQVMVRDAAGSPGPAAELEVDAVDEGTFGRGELLLVLLWGVLGVAVYAAGIDGYRLSRPHDFVVVVVLEEGAAPADGQFDGIERAPSTLQCNNER